MSYGYIKYRLLASFDLVIRKIIQHLVIYALYLTFVDSYTDKQCNDAFCHRHHMHTVITLITVPAV